MSCPQRVSFSAGATDPVACYRELSEKVRTELTALDPYFDRLADAMVVWLECWEELNPDN
jgi:reversibly glycosylated polypeptide/UDP-arabinopyranose mutase